MKFMTPASVQNLPNYLAEDRQRSLLQREEERYQEEKNSRKNAAKFMSAVYDVATKSENQEELFSGLDQVKGQFKDLLTPEMMTGLAGAVQRFKQDEIAKQQRNQQNTIFEQGQQDRSDQREASTLLGKYANKMPAMGITGEGVGLNSMGVPASDAAKMGYTQDSILKKLTDNPFGAQLLLERQDKEAERAQQAKMDQSLLDLRAAQAENYRAPKAASKPSSLSINDSQKIMETVYGDLMAQNGYTQTEYGMSDGQGKPIAPQETQRLQKISRHIAGDVQKMMQSGGISYPEAIQKATQTYQQNVSAVASGIYDGIQKGSLSGLDQVPEYMQVDAIKQLSQKTGIPVNKLLDQIDSVSATPTPAPEDNDTTTEDGGEVAPPPETGKLQSLAETDVQLPDKKVYGVPVKRSGNSPLSAFQSAISKLPVYQSQKDKFPLPGETKIEMAIRMAYDEKYNLQDRKRMAENMRKKFPNMDDEQIATAILSGGHEAGNLDDWGQHLLEK
jgi:hypothetical protein